jgi:hypothetical protein
VPKAQQQRPDEQDLLLHVSPGWDGVLVLGFARHGMRILDGMAVVTGASYARSNILDS